MLRVVLASAAPSEEVAWREFLSFDPSARVALRPEPGVRVAETSRTWKDLARVWGEAPPVFVRHVAPLSLRVDPAEAAAHLDPARSFSVQTRSFPHERDRVFSSNRTLSDALVAKGFRLDVRAPEEIVSVLLAGDLAGMGVSLSHENLSDWTGGECRFAYRPETISRAEFKLLEAVRVFGIELPSRGLALDMGASPGGWTRILSARGLEVAAVDPAELDPRVAALPGVRHDRRKIAEFLAESRETYDLVVCDLRVDAREAAETLLAARERLAAGGIAIATLKLPRPDDRATFDLAATILRRVYRVRARQLFHNRSEVTVALG